MLTRGVSLFEQQLIKSRWDDCKEAYHFRLFGTYWSGYDQANMYNLVMRDLESDLGQILGDCMASRKDKSDFVFKGFVNVNLSVETKAAFRKWDLEEVEKYNLTSGAIVLGYKFSQSYDNHNNAFTASMTCKDAKSPNFGLTLTARAGDLYTAELLLLFKHIIILEQNWEDYQPDGDDLLG